MRRLARWLLNIPTVLPLLLCAAAATASPVPLGHAIAPWFDVVVPITVAVWLILFVIYVPRAVRRWRRLWHEDQALRSAIAFMTGGHCPKCGYDLRATPNRCPECGALPPRL